VASKDLFKQHFFLNLETEYKTGIRIVKYAVAYLSVCIKTVTIFRPTVNWIYRIEFIQL